MYLIIFSKEIVQSPGTQSQAGPSTSDIFLALNDSFLLTNVAPKIRSFESQASDENFPSLDISANETIVEAASQKIDRQIEDAADETALNYVQFDFGCFGSDNVEDQPGS